MQRIAMPVVASISVLLLTLCSCASNAKRERVEDKIRAVEQGLVEFTTPAALFAADEAAYAGSLSLSDRMAHYKVPGVSVAVVSDFALEWARGYGVLRSGGDAAVTTSTLFQAASTSKLVAATIVLHYVDDGSLDLDQDVNLYLKSWQLPENEFTRENKVTLRLLLTHQAGLPETNFPQKEGAPDPTLVQVLNGELPAMNKPAVVEMLPGSKWQYSNIGYVVIQQVLEDVVGKPYSVMAREVVFEPLKMKNSTFVYPLEQALRDREAMPHDADGILREPAIGPPALAQGGLVTTPSDLALFAAELMSAYAGRSHRVVSREAARLMLSRQVDLDPAMFGVPLNQGLGPFIHGEGAGFVFVLPGSNFPGMNCWLLGFPETGNAVVVMTNGAMGEVLAMEVISAVNREYVITGAVE